MPKLYLKGDIVVHRSAIYKYKKKHQAGLKPAASALGGQRAIRCATNAVVVKEKTQYYPNLKLSELHKKKILFYLQFRCGAAGWLHF